MQKLGEEIDLRWEQGYVVYNDKKKGRKDRYSYIYKLREFLSNGFCFLTEMAGRLSADRGGRQSCDDHALVKTQQAFQTCACYYV